MDRRVCLLLISVLLVGCQPQVPLENPFMPQTTVPPPGTAGTMGAPIYGAPQVQVAPSVTVPANPGMPATMVPAPAAVSPGILPPTTAPQQSAPYYPGGAFDFRQGAVGHASESELAADGPMPETAPVDVLSARDESSANIGEAGDEPELFAQLTHPENALAGERLDARFPSDTSFVVATRSTSAGGDRRLNEAIAATVPRVAADDDPIRVVEREQTSGGWSPSRHEMQRNGLASSSNRDAPHVQTVAHAGTAAATASTVALASYNKAASTLRQERGHYAFSEDYGRLSGRLEFVQSTGQWKLRYVPIDGATDGYGGSVVISNPAVLEGRCPGDFVTIQGEIISDRAASSRYAPKYEARQVLDQPAS